MRQAYKRTVQRRLGEGDMLSAAGIATMFHLSVEEILAMVRCGRAIGIERSPGDLRLPFWQFQEPLWSLLPTIRDASTCKDPLELVGFLEQEAAELEYLTPRVALERGHLDRVLDLAKYGLGEMC
ncbi:hypothetical protein ABE85_07960 [Mitsuaria sp. 7]|nr:hypothetical protein ABE85_07960 [Mitsuaria sp. 7]